MNFVKDKIRMVLFGLIIASVMLVHHVKAPPSADSKQNGKEYPASRFNGNKSHCPVIDSTIIDTELERGRNERQTENRILLTYCLVTSCLLLEVFICVVLQLRLWKKSSQTRPERQDAENTPPTVTNPIYQPGLQRPCISNPLPITHQGPYQPLIVNTSERGGSAEYRALEGGHRDDQLVGVPVDVTDYQDLDQTNPREKYKSLLVVGSFSEDRECFKDSRHSDEPNTQEILKETDATPCAAADASSSVFHSVRSARSRVLGCKTSSTPYKHSPTHASQLNQSTKGPLQHTLHLEIITEKEPGALPRNICNFPRETGDQMHRVIKELETTVNMRALDGHDAGEPLYYVLEGPLSSPESNGDPMHCVVKELESLNKNGPKRAPSEDDFNTEPLYSVLESPEDSENKRSKEETDN